MGLAEGFIDPSTGKSRTIPLEIMVDGDKAPIYGETLEVCTRQFLLFIRLLHGCWKFWLLRMRCYCSCSSCGHAFQELGLYKAQTKLPFNAFGTMAMAREVSLTHALQV